MKRKKSKEEKNILDAKSIMVFLKRGRKILLRYREDPVYLEISNIIAECIFNLHDRFCQKLGSDYKKVFRNY